MNSKRESPVMYFTNGIVGSQDQLLSATIAGFISHSQSSRATNLLDSWRVMINHINDPYARIILSKIGGEEWDSVLKEEAVPILDRIGIAVCNLSDDEVCLLSTIHAQSS